MGLVQNANQASRQDLAAREGGQKPEEGPKNRSGGHIFKTQPSL